MKFILSKTFRFEAAHALKDHGGKCRNLHGHSWEAVVSVSGTALDGKTNMLIDYALISALVKPLVRQLDHTHLNSSTDEENPTSEYIANWFYTRLAAPVACLANESNIKPLNLKLHSIEVKETCTCSCTLLCE
jgi:6-pyruvoyltetrahydropterin/6-carboxytetrahydropterin synthase